MKGISPVIALVLIIAFVVAIAGIVNVWLTSIATEQTETVEQRTETFIDCSTNEIIISKVKYDSSGSPALVNVSIETRGTEGMKNVTFTVIGGGFSTRSQVYFNGSGDSLAAGSAFAASINTTGGALLPPETVIASGLCQGQSVTGRCEEGQKCMNPV